ncbi:LUD domain-containing protein [Geoglobus acetivorans]|uniref:LUD domain-containing protein n=1 Tax=Geoglobus acetivorans TaxID=565033 RepID=A0ABZ3H493_GEOAI|nr:hypothetical protein [Geoglobus acetivorans]
MGIAESLKHNGVEVIVTDNAEKEIQKFGNAHVSIALSADENTGIVFFGGFEEKKNAGLADHHVVILKTDDVKSDIISAYRHALNKSGMLFASSSASKTADIEGKLVFGMHGPRKLTVIIEVKE